MTLKRHLLSKRMLRAALPLAGLGAVAAAISGCGGASTTNNPTVATPDSGPVIYGQNALAIISGSNVQGETSGLTFTLTGGAAEGALVAATNYKAVTGSGPLPSYQASFPPIGIPTGFSPGGVYFNDATSVMVAAVPTNYAGSLVFGVYISPGVRNNNPVDLNTSSVVLTSSEAPTFSQPLAFDPAFGSGVLAQTQYKTAAFPLPTFMQTTGLHNLHTTVSDVVGQSSTTDFVVATVAPTAVALFLQSLTVYTPASVSSTGAAIAATVVTTAITPGDTVTIDGGSGTGVYPTGYAPTVADAQGTVVLFTAPGTHTLTETNSKGTVQTETFTLDATTAGTTILTPPTPAGAPTGAIRVIHAAAKRTFQSHK